MTEFKPVVFKLCNELYGVDIGKVVGIERQQNVVRVPNTVDYIKGIINLRGEIIAVYDLRQKFGLPAAENQAEQQFIIVKVRDSKVALEVDGVDEIHNVEEGDAFPMPAIVLNEQTGYFKEVIKTDKGLIVTLDADYLFSDEEFDKIGKMVEQL